MSSKRIAVLEQQLAAAEAAYYNTGTALMEDAQYDALRAELTALAPDSPALTRVGAPPAAGASLQKRKHTIPMGSLDKAMNRDEWDAWVAKMAAAGHTRFTASLKMDGGSVSLEYRDGALVQAVTRGDGAVGEDITANVLRFRDVPTKGVTLDGRPFTGFVRGEIMLTHADWQKADPDQTSNPRNLGNGISRRKDGEQAELLTVYAFRAHLPDGTEISATEASMAAALTQMGFTVANWHFGSAEELWAWFEEEGRERATLPYWIDGVVVKVDDIAGQRALGTSSGGNPRGQVAIKFPAVGAETEVESVELTVGHTGAVIPVAKLKPCQIGGVTVASVLLCNWSIIEALDVAVGDTVEVVRSGDVIPKVCRVVKRPKGRRPIAPPTRCPSCDGPVAKRANTGGDESTAFYCASATCPAQAAGKIARFIASLNILGIGDEVLAALIDQCGVKSAADLFVLSTLNTSADLGDIMLSNGVLGESRAERILAEIDKVRTLTLAEFLGSIGIDGLGKRRVTLIQAAVGGQLDTLDDWLNGKLAGLAEAAGVPNTGARISADVVAARPLIQQFLANGVIITAPKLAAAKAAPKGGGAAKSFCITGTLTRGREEYVALIEAAGHTFKSSVAKGLDYLVIADPESTSGKAVKARKLGVQCIGEDRLNAILEGRDAA